MFISKRKSEPAHYMFKIESFSLLSEAQTIKVESDVFEASGHKWRLDLHPNGNGEENDGNHISLYLVICDTESCSKPWEVCVDVNFFVYDHIRNNFATFQGVDGNRTKFQEKQIKWGFDQLISLESFKESTKGYLFNDSCVFGAEVFSVPKFSKKDRCLSMTKPPPTMNTYTWTIANFSSVTEKVLHSEVFKVGNIKWILTLPLKGDKNTNGDGTHLSIYLNVHDAVSLPHGWRVYAKFKLRVKTQSTYLHIESETENWFCSEASGWGFHKFMLLSTLDCFRNIYLLNDNLIVEAEISVIGTFKNYI